MNRDVVSQADFHISSNIKRLNTLSFRNRFGTCND